VLALLVSKDIAPFFGPYYGSYILSVALGFVIFPTITVTIICFCILFLSSVGYGVYKRSRALNIVRRRIVEGTYSYHVLVPLLDTPKLRGTLRCFFETAPRAHYEMK
jgi:hypothetical protein